MNSMIRIRTAAWGASLCFATVLTAQGNAPGAPAGGADKKNEGFGMKSYSLEKFEEAEDWNAKATCPLGETKVLKTVQRGDLHDTFDPNIKPDDDEKPKDNNVKNHVLGVKTYFCEKGFDRVEVFPPHEYVLEGKPRQFTVWVLGRNFRHTLFIKLRDYRGTIHKLRLGRLNFFGWRKLALTVPGWLPQSERYALMDKRMQFVSLYVEADPHETTGDFFFYVDNLRYASDTSDGTYPGAEIKDNW